MRQGLPRELDRHLRRVTLQMRGDPGLHASHIGAFLVHDLLRRAGQWREPTITQQNPQERQWTFYDAGLCSGAPCSDLLFHAGGAVEGGGVMVDMHELYPLIALSERFDISESFARRDLKNSLNTIG